MDVVIDAVVDFLLGKGKGQRREGGTEATKQCGGKRPEERTAGCQKQGNRQLLKKGRGQKREREANDQCVGQQLFLKRKRRMEREEAAD